MRKLFGVSRLPRARDRRRIAAARLRPAPRRQIRRRDPFPRAAAGVAPLPAAPHPTRADGTIDWDGQWRVRAGISVGELIRKPKSSPESKAVLAPRAPERSTVP